MTTSACSACPIQSASALGLGKSGSCSPIRRSDNDPAIRPSSGVSTSPMCAIRTPGRRANRQARPFPLGTTAPVASHCRSSAKRKTRALDGGALPHNLVAHEQVRRERSCVLSRPRSDECFAIQEARKTRLARRALRHEQDREFARLARDALSADGLANDTAVGARSRAPSRVAEFGYARDSGVCRARGGCGSSALGSQRLCCGTGHRGAAFGVRRRVAGRARRPRARCRGARWQLV